MDTDNRPRLGRYRVVQDKPFLEPSKYQNPVSYTMTPAALRARRPYFVGNMLTAGCLFALVGGIYYYSFKAFSADNFQDVPIPPISEEDLILLKAKRDEQSKKTGGKS